MFGVSFCIFAVSSSAWSASDLLVGVLAIAAAAGVQLYRCARRLAVQLSVLLQAVCREQWSRCDAVPATLRVRHFGTRAVSDSSI